MECTVWSSAFHNIHRKAKKLPGSLKVNYIQPILLFPVICWPWPCQHPAQLGRYTYASSQPSSWSFPLILHLQERTKQKSKLWNRVEESENSKPELSVLFSLLQLPPWWKMLDLSGLNCLIYKWVRWISYSQVSSGSNIPLWEQVMNITSIFNFIYISGRNWKTKSQTVHCPFYFYTTLYTCW